MRAYVEAYGCTLNVGESREIKELLVSRGWQLTETPDDADLAVLATCVVIEKTEREMLRRVKVLSSAPRLIITGCMATACAERAASIAPEAVFVGPGDLRSFDAAIGDQPARSGLPLTPDDSYAIVPISSGCVGSCAYCITRLARGELVSRPVEAIVSRVRDAVARGPKEIQLTGQDTASYGADIGTSLPALVERVCELGGDFRVRVGMMNPRSALMQLDGLAAMYRSPKVFKFLHLPAQSGSDAVLERMGRGYSSADFRNIVSRLRAEVPTITLSTDIIVGYPGETDEDHRSNMEILSQVEPDIVNVTRFSPRPGTVAAAEPNQVVGWKAKNRSRELTALRFRIGLKKNQMLIGRSVRALSTERGKADSTIFRTDEYKQIVVPLELELGRWSVVRVTRATPTYLIGVLEGPG